MEKKNRCHNSINTKPTIEIPYKVQKHSSPAKKTPIQSKTHTSIQTQPQRKRWETFGFPGGIEICSPSHNCHSSHSHTQNLDFWRFQEVHEWQWIQEPPQNKSQNEQKTWRTENGFCWFWCGGLLVMKPRERRGERVGEEIDCCVWGSGAPTPSTFGLPF